MSGDELLSPERFSQLKTIALLVFFGAFMLIVVWLIFSNRGAHDRAARIPLEDDPAATGEATDTEAREPRG